MRVETSLKRRREGMEKSVVCPAADEEKRGTARVYPCHLYTIPTKPRSICPSMKFPSKFIHCILTGRRTVRPSPNRQDRTLHLSNGGFQIRSGPTSCIDLRVDRAPELGWERSTTIVHTYYQEFNRMGSETIDLGLVVSMFIVTELTPSHVYLG